MQQNLQSVEEGYAYSRDIVLMTMPLLLMSFLYYGPRCLLLAAVAMLTARLCDRLVALLRSRPYNKADRSSVAFALLITLLMPASVPIRVLVAAVLMAVLVAKEAFGGFESYPFHPAAVGYCMAAVSWPELVMRYPPLQVWFMSKPESFSKMLETWSFANATLVNGPSSSLKAGGLPSTDLFALFLGNYAGPMGVTSVIVVLACAVFLLVRRRINLVTPLCFLAAAFVMVFIFPRVELPLREGDIALLVQLRVALYEVLTGATVFVAFFLSCDPGVQPTRTLSRALYGVLLGVATVMFRHFGIFELGACFALLLVNSLSGFIDRVGRPKPARVEEVAPL